MSNIREIYKCMGSKRQELDAAVPDNEFMLNTHTGVTYQNKYAGGAHIYVPTSTVPLYAFHLSAESATSGAHFVGMEVALATSTTFTFNYIAGTIQATGAVIDRVSAVPGALPFGADYKVQWYIDRNGPGDTCWVNDVAHTFSNIPVQNVTYIHTTQFLFSENTPAGFALYSIWTSVDHTMTYDTFNAMRLMAPYKVPVYQGIGHYTPDGHIRPLYMHSNCTGLHNFANNTAFVEKTPGTILYSKKNARFTI
jgi:hypothetical protein